MSRDLPATLDAEVLARVTRPGYLVETLFSTPVRWSTRGTFSVLGSTWTAYDVRVSGIASQGIGGSVNPALSCSNTDLEMSALVLGEGVVGRRVTIWKFYGDAPTASLVIEIFRGVCTGSKILPNQRVNLSLGSRGSTVLRSPRSFMLREEGFSLLPARGATITMNGETYRAEPED